MSRKGMSVVITFLIIVILGGAILFTTGILFPREQVITPEITPVFSGQVPIRVSSSFPFQKGSEAIVIEVNGSVFEGARRADKSVTIIGNISNSTWIAQSYRSMIDDPAQENLYQDLIRQFRSIKDRRGLSDDEYLELIAVYVQSLQYETIGENPAKFPVETVVDSAGDCDDKSLLLAGLLSREGYRVALLSFGPEKHMAVGIGSDDFHYRNTSLAFVETTNISFIGIPTEKLGSDSVLSSMPEIIPVGDGMKTYTSAAQVRAIHEMQDYCLRKIQELGPDVRSSYEILQTMQEEITMMEHTMQSLKSAGDIRGYNAQVLPHNEKVADYNARLEAYRRLFSQFEYYLEINNYIIEHPYDRKGVYEYIRSIPSTL